MLRASWRLEEERLREWTVKFPSDLGNWFVSCCPLFQKAPYYSGSRTTIMCAVAVVYILSAFSFGFLKRNGPVTAVKIVSKRRERAFYPFRSPLHCRVLLVTCKYAQEAIYWPFHLMPLFPVAPKVRKMPGGIQSRIFIWCRAPIWPFFLESHSVLGESFGVLKWWPRRCLVCPKSLWRLNHSRLLSWMLWWPRELGQRWCWWCLQKLEEAERRQSSPPPPLSFPAPKTKVVAVEVDLDSTTTVELAAAAAVVSCRKCTHSHKPLLQLEQ